MKRWILRAAVGLLGAVVSLPGWSQDKVTFMTSWYAQAEHGGFYQALATGLYRLRFVTHLDVDEAGVDRALAVMGEFFSQ